MQKVPLNFKWCVSIGHNGTFWELLVGLQKNAWETNAHNSLVDWATNLSSALQPLKRKQEQHSSGSIWDLYP